MGGVSDDGTIIGTICAFLPTATSCGSSGRILVTTRMFLALVGIGDRKVASPPNAFAVAGGEEKNTPVPLAFDASSVRGVAMVVDPSVLGAKNGRAKSATCGSASSACTFVHRNFFKMHREDDEMAWGSTRSPCVRELQYVNTTVALFKHKITDKRLSMLSCVNRYFIRFCLASYNCNNT